MIISWKPPNHGWFKCNTDGSYIDASNGVGKISVIGVIRDCSGNWVKGFACPLGRGSSLLAKLWAIYIGIQVALDFGCLHLEIESDCLLAINLITAFTSHETHHYASIVDSCRLKITKLSQFRINHVLREENYLADRLASYACFCNSLVILDKVPPICFFSLFFCWVLWACCPRKEGH